MNVKDIGKGILAVTIKTVFSFSLNWIITK